MTFPVELVPQAANLSGGSPAGHSGRGRAVGPRSQPKRLLSRLDFILGPVIFLAALILMLVTRRRSVRHPVLIREIITRTARQLCSGGGRLSLPPGHHRPEDFTATVLDLARRGHLRLEEYQAESGFIRKKQFTDYRLIPEGGDRLTRKRTCGAISLIRPRRKGRSQL